MRDLREIQKKEASLLVEHVERLHQLRADDSARNRSEELTQELVELYHHKLDLLY